MLLSNRRQGLLHFCIAGMETAWFTPILLYAFHIHAWESSPLAVFGGLFATLLLWMLAIDLLNRLAVDSPQYELSVAWLVVLSSLLIVRLWLYRTASFSDFVWLGNTVYALLNFFHGLKLELVLVGANLFLWQRAVSAINHEMGLFRVGFQFRLGTLLLIIGASGLNRVSGQSVTFLLWIYFSLGLTAVALARVHDKATGARSAGRLLPANRLAQLIVAVGLTVGSAVGLARLYTPDKLKTPLRWLNPLWTVLGRVLWVVLVVILRLLEPLLIWLARLFRDVNWEELLENIAVDNSEQFVERSQGTPLSIPPWIQVNLRYIITILLAAAALGFVLLYLRRTRPAPIKDEAEEEEIEDVTLGGGILERGARWLRDMTGMVRRYGLSRQLLAAISVQNIYANLCRLAARRGYPRHRALPPDGYLPILIKTFGSEAEGSLSRITYAYMRVHYGDEPVLPAELAQLQMDYRRVRLTKPKETA